MMKTKIPISEALADIRAAVAPLPVERVALSQAAGRMLAEPICSDVDDPPFHRALMDGFAVRAADTKAAPVRLRVVGLVAAGGEPNEESRPLRPGQAIQINTGAPLPAGADAVVRVEDTDHHAGAIQDGAGAAAVAHQWHALDGAEVEIRTAVSPGKAVMPRGSNIRAGVEAVPAGTRLSPLEIGAAATCGAAEVSVLRKPRIGIVVTGDELIAIDEKPTGSAIRDSNRYILSALGTDAGLDVDSSRVVGDDKTATRDAIGQALNVCDVLCTSGGVSMGSADYVPQVIGELGATIRFHKVAIKPGGPVLFATMPDGKLVFGLPGNPISAFVCWHLLVLPACAMLQGHGGPVAAGSLTFTATLGGDMARTGDRQAYWPGRAHVGADGQWQVEPLPWRGSGDPFGMVSANALIVRPSDSPAAGVGECVRVMLL